VRYLRVLLRLRPVESPDQTPPPRRGNIPLCPPTSKDFNVWFKFNVISSQVSWVVILLLSLQRHQDALLLFPAVFLAKSYRKKLAMESIGAPSRPEATWQPSDTA
jgi:hypothetical protein